MEKREQFWKKKRYLVLAVAIVVLIILVYWAQPGAILDNILEAEINLLAAAVLLNVLTTCLLLGRWVILYREISPNLRIFDSCKIYMIGQATNQIAPMGTGEITRAYVGSRYYKINFSKTLVSAVIERMSDILFFLALAFVCFTLIIQSGRFYIQLVLFILFAILGFIYVLRPHTMDRFFLRLEKLFKRGGKFLQSLSKKLLSSWEIFKNSMYRYHERKGTLVFTGVLTIAVWMLDAFTQFTLFKAFGVEIPYFHVLAIVSASFIIGALSFLPGGLGAREGSFAYFTMVVLEISSAVPSSEGRAIGMAVALVYKGIVYLVIISFAAVSFASLPKKPDEEDESERSRN
jgi:uncharacterized protein (TIRG00374 family)